MASKLTQRFVGPIDRWCVCPSTHCERHQECRSPHECSGTGKNLSAAARAALEAKPANTKGEG